MATEMELPEELERLLVHEKAFDALPEACERLEAEHKYTLLHNKCKQAMKARHWPWALHVLSLARVGHLQAARFAYQRSPESARSGAELSSAWLTVRHLYCRDFAVRSHYA